MYLSFYKLSENPFNVGADHRFIWLGEKHQEALANLEYGLLESNGYVVLTGGVGTGKTTVVNALLESLNDNVRVATVNHPTLNPLEFFNLVAQVLGVPGKFVSKTDFLLAFKTFLQTSHASGKVVLLIIDEAHRLSTELLEEIHLLSNIEKQGKKLLNIFLIGQNELKERLLSRRCRALWKRITLSYKVDPLSEGETFEYIVHRLKVAGADRNLFTQAAIRRIHNSSKGYPLLINTICDRALLTGFVKEQQKINEDVVTECIREIDSLDSKTRKISYIPFGIFLGWGRFWAARAQAHTAVLMNPRGRKEDTPGNKNLKTISLFGGLKQITRVTVNNYRRKLIPIGISTLTALVFATISFGLYNERPVPHNASRRADLAGSRQTAQLPVGPDTSANLKKPENDSEPLIREKVSKAPNDVLPGANKNPDEAPDAGNSKARSAQIAARTLSDKKFPPSETAKFSESQTTPEQKPNPLDLASSALDQNNFERALELLDADLNLDIKTNIQAREIYSRALVGRAAQIVRTSPHKAQTLLTKAIEVNPNNVEAHFNLGKLYARSEEYTLAIAAYRETVTLNPKLTDAFFNLGFIYAKTGMYENAENLFQQSVQLKPAYLDKALFNLAVVQEKLGKRKACLANLQMALSIRPDNQKAQTYLKQLAGPEEGNP